jgi:subtilisin family serine protease
MNRYFLVFFFIIIVSNVLICQQSKVDSKLFVADVKDNQNIVVILHAQADVSQVKSLKGKDNKANFMYEQLTTKAKNTQNELTDLLKSKGKSFRSFYIVNMVSLIANMALIEEIAALGSVKNIIRDGDFVMLEPILERTVGQNRGIEWNIQYRGWNGSVADHDYNWHDAIIMDNPISPGTNSCGFNSIIPCDDNNHGTHTMGTMVGDDGGSNQIGVAPGAKWIGCRNMENGYGTLTTYVECFEWFLAPTQVGGTCH